MNLIKLFLLLPLSQIIWATTVYAAEASDKPGATLLLTDNSEISDLDKSKICLPFEGGHIVDARENGIKLFGSFENYYANLHRIECANSPTPN